MSIRPPRRLPGQPADDAFDLLQGELVREKAATLARLGKRLEDGLNALAAFDATHGRAALSPAGAERRDELVGAAGESLWYYVVQREVCGFGHSEALMRELSIPREVRLRMGIARRRQDG